jgi:hypothetical protein
MIVSLRNLGVVTLLAAHTACPKEAPIRTSADVLATSPIPTTAVDAMPTSADTRSQVDTRSQIVASDVTFVGYYNVPHNGWEYNGDASWGNFNFANGGFGMRKVAGVNHFYIAQSYPQGCGPKSACNGAPVEFMEPASFNESGVCTSEAAKCPNPVMASGPGLTFVTNWGLNADGSAHDFYEGKQVLYWANDGFHDLRTAATIELHHATITPRGDWLTTYDLSYGNNPDFYGTLLVTLDSPNDGAGHPVTHAYGPLVLETPPGAMDHKTGWFAGHYFVHMPDGSFGFGAGDSGDVQQGNAPNGPSVMTMPSWPTSQTPVNAAARLTATKTWMRYYNLNGVMNPDGTLPRGQPNQSYRYGYLWPYVFEGNKEGTDCGQGACLAIDPAKNGGVGTWQEGNLVGGVLMIKTATKQGAIAFLSTSTNHLVTSNTTDCKDAAGQVVNHSWYCSGASVPRCAGPGGDYKSPVYRCTSLWQNTGPVMTHQEADWAIFRWSDLEAVAAGTRIDYTVDPIDHVWPETQWSMPFPSAESGDANIRHEAFPGRYDTDTNLFYVLIPRIVRLGPTQQPLIAVFHVKQ